MTNGYTGLIESSASVQVLSTQTLEITPAAPTVEKGATLQLSVTAKDALGNPVPTPTGLR